jgi:hypothetical protein
MAQIEVIVPVEIFPIQSYVDGFFYNGFNLSCAWYPITGMHGALTGINRWTGLSTLPTSIQQP